MINNLPSMESTKRTTFCTVELCPLEKALFPMSSTTLTVALQVVAESQFRLGLQPC